MTNEQVDEIVQLNAALGLLDKLVLEHRGHTYALFTPSAGSLIHALGHLAYAAGVDAVNDEITKKC